MLLKSGPHLGVRRYPDDYLRLWVVSVAGSEFCSGLSSRVPVLPPAAGHSSNLERKQKPFCHRRLFSFQSFWKVLMGSGRCRCCYRWHSVCVRSQDRANGLHCSRERLSLSLLQAPVSQANVQSTCNGAAKTLSCPPPPFSSPPSSHTLSIASAPFQNVHSVSLRLSVLAAASRRP